MSLTLAPEELVELTGYKRPSGQRAWLQERAWVFEVDAKGRPKVLRAYAEGKMGVKNAAPKAWKPDFSDLRAAG
jgi:hypothetical protein